MESGPYRINGLEERLSECESDIVSLKAETEVRVINAEAENESFKEHTEALYGIIAVGICLVAVLLVFMNHRTENLVRNNMTRINELEKIIETESCQR